MKLKLFACLFAAPLFALSVSAQANTFVREAAFGPGLSSVNLTLPVGTGNYGAGFQTINVSPTANDAAATSFAAYCIDPAHFANGSYLSYLDVTAVSVPIAFAPRATDIQKLFDMYYGGTTTGPNQAAKSAAFQLALWEIANDDSSLTSGGVQKTGSTTPSLVTDTNTILASYASYAGPQIYDLKVYLVDRSQPGPNGTNYNKGQDYIVAMPVPEPSTYALLVAGLGFVAFSARRSGKQV